jgi:sulfonate transport system permease protein
MTTSRAPTLETSRGRGRFARWPRRVIPRPLSVAALVILAVGWQVASYLVPTIGFGAAPRVPGWEHVFSKGFVGLSDYWMGGWGAPSPIFGGKQTVWGAVLVVVWNSVITGKRVLLGLLIGIAVGFLLGIAMSASQIIRRITLTPANFLRMVPMLAMIRLFQIWFGAATVGVLSFVAYGISIIIFVGTINSIANVPRRYGDYAKTLGASTFRVYRTVILPAAVPELASSIFLSLGLAWTLVLGSEFLGVQDGLGMILITAGNRVLTERLVFVSLFFILYAGLSVILFNSLMRKWLRWMPARADKADRWGAAQVDIRR